MFYEKHDFDKIFFLEKRNIFGLEKMFPPMRVRTKLRHEWQSLGSVDNSQSKSFSD